MTDAAPMLQERFYCLNIRSNSDAAATRLEHLLKAHAGLDDFRVKRAIIARNGGFADPI
jgi:hypothetical protein